MLGAEFSAFHYKYIDDFLLQFLRRRSRLVYPGRSQQLHAVLHVGTNHLEELCRRPWALEHTIRDHCRLAVELRDAYPTSIILVNVILPRSDE